jgi:hypothetical protein
VCVVVCVCACACMWRTQVGECSSYLARKKSRLRLCMVHTFWFV